MITKVSPAISFLSPILDTAPLHLRTNLCIILLSACSSCLRLVPSSLSGSRSSRPLPPQAPHSSLELWHTLFPLLPSPRHPLFTWLCNISGPGRLCISPKPSLVPQAGLGLPGLLQLPELPLCGSNSKELRVWSTVQMIPLWLWTEVSGSLYPLDPYIPCLSP